MDAVLLARIQFAMQAGFHFFFPPLTFGVGLVVLILEILHYRTDDETFKKLSTFGVRILALIFAVGVATGIVMEFSFGTNWSSYSRLVGDIFGAPLAAEGVFAFFLESTFLGIVIFGRDKISKKAYLVAVFLVFFGSHLSGLWIIIANSWMQTPAGYEMVNGVARMTDFFAAAINHSTIERFLHVVVAAWITGSAFMAGIAAWYLLKKRDEKFAQPLLKVALTVFMIAAVLQFVTGHSHSVQVAKTQPAKMAAFEALWKTQKNAPMSIIGIPNVEKQEIAAEVAIPGLLSFMIGFDSSFEVKGLNDFPKEDWPPVVPVYFAYHFMVGLGTLFALMAIIGGILMATGKLYTASWYHRLLLLISPLPLLSNELGWMAAEIGRQPWAVYNVLRTSHAASPTVSAGELVFSNIMFLLIYIILGAMFIKLLKKTVKDGPMNAASTGY
jgi:cytochrome bd ubiquinol oxidase subunit I